MNLTDLIRDMKSKGIMSVAPIKLRGTSKATLEFLALMNDTEAFNPSKDICEVIAAIYAENGGSVR